MPAYCLFDNLEVIDPSKLDEYKRRVAPVVEQYQGRYVVLGGPVELLEGDAGPSFPIMIEFPSAELARRWYHSDEYLELKALRLDAVRSNAVLLEGVDAPRRAVSKRVINPWTWQESQAWSWAIETTGAQRELYCAGQISTDEQGRVLHVGDMAGQIRRALDNLETVLEQAGYALADLVRIDYYTPDPDALMRHWPIIAERLRAAGCKAGGVLLGVTQLAIPELLIEIEATAAR